MSSTTTPAVALEASGLGKRYGRRGAALDGCSFRLPAGRVSALVGPNGAGKSTLLAIAAGLLRPTSGTLTVLGGAPGEHRARVAHLAQTKPLYPQLTIAQTLRMGAELNPARWDAAHAARIVEQGGLDPKSRIRSLSGGQRTRVALALALGKRPELMLLDEPMADLDPLARHELMGTLMADAAEHGTTVLMSSHIVAELADACDHLLLLGGGRIRLGGGIDDLLTAHTVVTGRGTPDAPDPERAHRDRVPPGRPRPDRPDPPGRPGRRGLGDHGTLPGGTAPRPPARPRSPGTAHPEHGPDPAGGDRVSAPTLETAAPAPAAPRSGLVRTVLRLHRAALWIWLAFVAGTAGFLLWLLGPGADTAQRALDTYGYSGLIMAMGSADEYSSRFYYADTLLTLGSFAVALFAGGALTARELESGTAQLAWTQGVTPRRWLTAKLALPAAALVVGGAVFVPVYRWAWSAHRDLMGDSLAFNDVFADHGPLVVAYGLCALAVGALTGLLLGRPLPALALSLILTTVLNRTLEHHRPSPVSTTAFWPAHLTETALVLTTAALATAATYGRLRRTTP